MKKAMIVFAAANKVRRGFTLLELLVVIGIIMVIMAIAMVNYTSTNQRTRDAKRKADMENIRSALELYRTDVGSYPASFSTNSNGCITGQIVDSGTGNVYMTTIPTDPRETSTYCYSYTRPTTTSYTLTCLFELAASGTCSYANP